MSAVSQSDLTREPSPCQENLTREPSPCQVQVASADDAGAMAAISAGEYDSWSGEQFLSTMESPVARVWSAKMRGETAGYGVVYYDSDGSELVQIAVDRGCRRGGVGTALLEEILRFLSEKGVPQIVLEVRSRNEAAVAFYKKAGFEKVTIQENYYRNPSDDALRMIRRID